MLRSWVMATVYLFCMVISTHALGDYVVVERTSNIKALPESDGEKLLKAKKGDAFTLHSTKKTNRYYPVILPSVDDFDSGDIGWIYDNRVDVKLGQHRPGIAASVVATECGQHLKFGIPFESDKILCHEGYALGYDYDERIPDWVSYAITDKSVDVNVARGSFRVDKSIPKKYRSSNTDYKASGYDRGHLAPSGSIDFSREANNETFLYSNMTPQLPEFNRDMMGMSGVWGRLERLERAWVEKRKSLMVIAGTVVPENAKAIGRGVEVPNQFFKIIYDPKAHAAISFLMLQDKNTGDQWESYVVSIDEIEAVTGWDFLTGLDEDLQQTVENAKANIDLWSSQAAFITENWCSNLASLEWKQVTLEELTSKCTPRGWESFFAQDAVKEQVKRISDSLERELDKPNTTISPSIGNVFRALYEVKPNKAKALIMGQDPAPQPGLATGLSFSLPPGTKSSAVASVQRVYLEAQNEKFCNNLDDADASRWADENVLLLNMALTIPCEKSSGKCYSGIADHVPLWSDFTQQLMNYIDTLEQPMAFILWGSKARVFENTITNPLHKAFEGGHPSPKANGNAFFCKGYFRCSNEWLVEKGGEAVDWSLTEGTCQLGPPCVYQWDSRTRTSSCVSSCEVATCL